jgi:hypothetical protein
MKSAPPIRPSVLLAFLLAAAPVAIFVYAFATRPLVAWTSETWHRQVVLRLVEPGSRLAERTGWNAGSPDSITAPRWLGTYRPELPWDFQTWYRMQSSLGTPLRIASWYQAWGDGPDHEFKSSAMSGLQREGIVPMVTWEPWVSAFDNFRGQTPSASLELVVSGRLDTYLRSWARAAAIHGKAFFLRPFHEPGNPWYPWGPEHGNPPELYRQAWTHVRNLFREEGARNAVFVWTPWQDADTAYWPGDDQVDWIGLDLFNYGTLAEDGQWMDFATLLRLQHDVFRRYGKPMLVAEVGSSDFGGNKEDWYRDLFKVLRSPSWPRVRAVVLFDNPSGATSTGLPVDWALSTLPHAMVRIGRDLAPTQEQNP